MATRALRVTAFGPVEDLVWAETPVGAAGPGEVVIDVRAAGLNLPDLLVAAGTYQQLPALPLTLGMEADLVASYGRDGLDIPLGEVIEPDEVARARRHRTCA